MDNAIVARRLCINNRSNMLFCKRIMSYSSLLVEYITVDTPATRQIKGIQALLVSLFCFPGKREQR